MAKEKHLRGLHCRLVQEATIPEAKAFFLISLYFSSIFSSILFWELGEKERKKAASAFVSHGPWALGLKISN